MQYIRINNWKKHQHYKDRRPTWVKLLVEIIEEFDANGIPKKYYPMPDNAKTTLLHLFCLRAKYNDKIPYPDNKWLKKHLGLRRITLQPLVDAGFIIIDTESVSKPYQGGTECAHQSNINKSNINKRTETYSVFFETFWKAFKGRWNADRSRYDKGSKLEAWEVWKKMTEADQQNAMKGASKTGHKFTPDAYRWLKGKRWET